jgi:2-methylcitrate dehydratase PrpD
MDDLLESPTLALARWAVQTQWAEVPEAARLATRRSWLNWWGCALGGAADPQVDRLVAALRPLGAAGSAPLLGRSERLDLPSAALVHAFASNILDFDDTHWATAIHPAGPVASAVVAWSSQYPCSGADALLAFLLGMEVECAVGLAVSPAHYAKGWHITASCGVFGAAAAVGRLMQLDENRMVWALGHAATQASGLVASLGSSAKSLNIAHAARNGLLAAQYAQAGLSASTAVLEDRFGFGALMGEGGFALGKLPGADAHWQVEDNRFKPYPCGFLLHPTLKACLALVQAHGVLAADAVAQITLRVTPLAATRANRPQPADGLQAKLSLQHAAAIMLLEGQAGVRRFTDAAVAQSQSLRAKVQVLADEGLSQQESAVEVQLHRGALLQARHTPVPGEEHPSLDDTGLALKFHDLLAHGAPHCDADRLLEQIRATEQLADLRALVGLTLS